MRQSYLPLLGLVAFMTGCGQDTPLVGTEKGACYRNSTCNSGLICLSQLCVRLPEAGLPSDARLDLPGLPPWPPLGDGFLPPKGDRGPKPPPRDAAADKTTADKTTADKTTADKTTADKTTKE